MMQARIQLENQICPQIIATAAQKVMYGVIRTIILFNLPISCQFVLFDKIVLPVLIYSCEIWGYENLQVIELIHLNILKHIFQLKKSTP
jgi:hypothetical protein